VREKAPGFIIALALVLIVLVLMIAASAWVVEVL